MFRKTIFLIAIVMTLSAALDAEAKQGFYIGIGTAYNTISGDFDGSSALQGANEVIGLPLIKNAFGIDLLAGWGINDAWAIELNLMASTHKGSGAGLNGDINYASFSINGKYNFLITHRAQPFIFFGLSSNTLLIKNGAIDLGTGQVADAKFSGSGFNLGFGLDAYFTPNLSLSPGLLYRYVDYTKATGVNNSGSISNGLNGSGFSLLLTLAYHF